MTQNIQPSAVSDDGVVGLITIAVLVAVLVGTVYLHRWRKTVWRRFARQSGLTFVRREVGPTMCGTHGEPDGEPETRTDSSDTGALGIEEVRMTVHVDLQLPGKMTS